MLLLTPSTLDRLLGKARAITEDDKSKLRSIGFSYKWFDNLLVGYDHDFGLFVLAGHVLIWTSMRDTGDFFEVYHKIEI